MFSLWSRTQRSTPRPAAGDLPTLRMANLATRRCTKLASPVAYSSSSQIPRASRLLHPELILKRFGLVRTSLTQIEHRALQKCYVVLTEFRPRIGCHFQYAERRAIALHGL